MELAFFELDEQATSKEFFENKTDMFDMLLESIWINQYVIKVSNCKFVETFTNDIIDIPLKGAGGIA